MLVAFALLVAGVASADARRVKLMAAMPAEERFERVLKVLDLPDTPPFVARGGGYFDLGYLLRIDGTGEWVGHVGSKTRYIPLGPESLAYVMEQAGLESLPPAPDADPEDVKAAHKIDPRAYMLLPLPLLLILVAARLLRPKPKIKIALPPSAAELKAADMIKLAMDMAKEMNAGYTLISAAHAGYLTPPNVIWGRLAENLSELCEYAENIGMDLILEPLTPYESNVVCNANDVLHALALVPSPRLFSMVDICAPYVQAEPVMSYFDKLGDKLRHLHIVDSDGASDTHYIPGEGKMPLRELMRDIIDRGYEGYCTVELVTMYMNEPRLYARQALERFRALLPEDER